MCYEVAFISVLFPGLAIPRETSCGKDLRLTVSSHQGLPCQWISSCLLRTGLSSLSKEIQYLLNQFQGSDLKSVPNWSGFTTAVMENKRYLWAIRNQHVNRTSLLSGEFLRNFLATSTLIMKITLIY